MAKVTIHAGFTLHVGNPAVNEYGRVDVEIKDIDTELPLEDQMAKAELALASAWEKLLPVLDEQANAIVGVTIVRRGQS